MASKKILMGILVAASLTITAVAPVSAMTTNGGASVTQTTVTAQLSAPIDTVGGYIPYTTPSPARTVGAIISSIKYWWNNR